MTYREACWRNGGGAHDVRWADGVGRCRNCDHAEVAPDLDPSRPRHHRLNPKQITSIMWAGDNDDAVKAFCGQRPGYGSEGPDAGFRHFLDVGPQVWVARDARWVTLLVGNVIVRGLLRGLVVLDRGELARLCTEIDGPEAGR